MRNERDSLLSQRRRQPVDVPARGVGPGYTASFDIGIAASYGSVESATCSPTCVFCLRPGSACWRAAQAEARCARTHMKCPAGYLLLQDHTRPAMDPAPGAGCLR